MVSETVRTIFMARRPWPVRILPSIAGTVTPVSPVAIARTAGTVDLADPAIIAGLSGTVALTIPARLPFSVAVATVSRAPKV